MNISEVNNYKKLLKIEVVLGTVWFLVLLLPFEVNIFGAETEIGIYLLSIIILIYICYKNIFVKSFETILADWLVLIFFLFLFLSIFFVKGIASYVLLVRFYSYFLGAIGYFLIRVMDNESRKKLLFIFLILIFFWSIWRLAQIIISTPFGVVHSWRTAFFEYNISGIFSEVVESGASYANANYLNNWLFFGFFISLGASFMTNDKKNRIFFIMVYIFSGFAILFSFSRAAWLVLILGLVVFVFLSSKIKFYSALVFFVVLFSTIALLFILTPLTNVISKKLIIDESAAIRSNLNEIGIDMINNNPWFGVGVGSSEDAEKYYRRNEAFINKKPWEDPLPTKGLHNLYLVIGAENGLPSLGIFVLLVLIVLRRSYIKFKNNSNLIWTGFFAAFIALVLLFVVNTNPTFVFIWPMLWMMIALSLTKKFHFKMI